MKTSVDEFASILERLSEKVEELEARLSALEHRSAAADRSLGHAPLPIPISPAPLHDLPSSFRVGTLAIIGRVFLGIAGAYLLRSLAESGVVPQLAVAVVALFYAFAWLAWAAATRADAAFARVACAITSAGILCPMLWELTVRFNVLSPRTAATILAGFVLLASVLAWKRKLTTIVVVASLAAAGTSLGLLVATRDPAPFVLSLLVIALITELAGCHDRWLRVRPLTAAALDLGIFALLLIYTRPEGFSTEYTTMTSWMLLALVSAPFAIYGTSTTVRTLALRRKISVFEIGQTIAAFLLGAIGILRISSAARPALGAVCLLAAGAIYFASRPSAGLLHNRNYHVFASWAAALLLMASFLLVPDALRAPFLAAAALVAVSLGLRTARLTISFHGAIFLGAASVASGMLAAAAQIFVGAPPFALGWATWMTAGTTILAYAMVAREFSESDPWNHRLLRFVFAAQAAYVVAALSVVLIVSLASWAMAMTGTLLAVIRTLTICLAALGFAWTGSRCKRVELVWLAYIAIAACTLKLLLEDLRSGNAGSIAASLFCYGMAWVLVPRMARRFDSSILHQG